MTNFTVLTDEQAAHDAATSKRHLEALRETQAENARLRAHIQEAADSSHNKHVQIKSGKKWITISVWHLAALGETK